MQRRRIHCEIRFPQVGNGSAVQPTARMDLWGKVVHPHGREAVLLDHAVREVYDDLREVAFAALPPPAVGVHIDAFPLEPALFERAPGVDEARLRFRAVAADLAPLVTWAKELRRALKKMGVPTEAPQLPAEHAEHGS